MFRQWEQHFDRVYASTEIKEINCTQFWVKCIEILWITQKCEKYSLLYWTGKEQAENVTINWIWAHFGNLAHYETKELLVDYTQATYNE